MYNEQMENLISAALADGVLSEKEKQILFKKAESMGIDLDEFEMVLDARLVELKKKEARDAEQHELEMEKAKAAQKSAPKSNKFGDIRKCPACGAIVESFKIKCPECGCEFANIETNSTPRELLKALEKIDEQTLSNEGKTGSLLRGVASVFGADSLTARKVQIIKNFPIPNTKEDLLEMLTLSKANTSEATFSDPELVEAWQGKTKQLILKARLMAKNDPDFEFVLSDIVRDKKKKAIINFAIGALCLAILSSLLIMLYFLESNK